MTSETNAAKYARLVAGFATCCKDDDHDDDHDDDTINGAGRWGNPAAMEALLDRQAERRAAATWLTWRLPTRRARIMEAVCADDD